ncbi:MAG TPA: acyltransferase [Stellaceae bacterium]|nr:acyltransferase [Stellaceae bacterium]
MTRACAGEEINAASAARPRPQIPALTGLRGIAALLVSVYHLDPPDRGSASPVVHFVGKGYLWVDLFFVLSGFVVALNYAHLFETGCWSPRAWGDFLLRRLARVYPLYLAVTAAGLALALTPLHLPAVPRASGGEMTAANLLMVQSWGISQSINGAAWSLSAEWGAYLLFPVLVTLALFARPVLAWGALLTALAATAATVILTHHDGAYHSGPLDAYDGTTAEPVLRCLGGFTLGLVLCRAARSPRLLACISHDATIAAAVVLLVLGFAESRHDLLIYPLFAVLVLGLYGNRGIVGRCFGSRPVYRLGVLSYSIYLLHPYLVAPRADLDAWLRTRLSPLGADVGANVAVYGALLLAATLAYRAIEEPGRRWTQQLGRRLLGAVAGPASA